MDEDDDDNLYADAEDDLEEGHYVINERGAGDAGLKFFFKIFLVNFFDFCAADIADISRRMEENFVTVNYTQNGNDEDEFQDAD